MTIKKIGEENIEHLCDHCGAIREISLSSLSLGFEVEGHVTPNIIRLPPCDQCPTTEFLIVSDHVAPPNTQIESGSPVSDAEDVGVSATVKSAHQLLVDQLGKMISKPDR